MMYKKDRTLEQIGKFNAQPQVLVTPIGINLVYSPIAFVRCGRASLPTVRGEEDVEEQQYGEEEDAEEWCERKKDELEAV